MITAVDSNILIDIFANDPIFQQKSENALKQCLQNGVVCSCEIAWAETAITFHNNADFLDMVRAIDIEFSALSEKSVLAAASVWRAYRKAGGKRDKLPPDFLIGAHAMIQCDRLLTRDRGFYRQYFSDLKIIEP